MIKTNPGKNESGILRFFYIWSNRSNDQHPVTHIVMDTKGHWSRRRYQALLCGYWSTVDVANEPVNLYRCCDPFTPSMLRGVSSDAYLLMILTV